MKEAGGAGRRSFFASLVEIVLRLVDGRLKGPDECPDGFLDGFLDRVVVAGRPWLRLDRVLIARRP